MAKYHLTIYSTPIINICPTGTLRRTRQPYAVANQSQSVRGCWNWLYDKAGNLFSLYRHQHFVSGSCHSLSLSLSLSLTLASTNTLASLLHFLLRGETASQAKNRSSFPITGGAGTTFLQTHPHSIWSHIHLNNPSPFALLIGSLGPRLNCSNITRLERGSRVICRHNYHFYVTKIPCSYSCYEECLV